MTKSSSFSEAEDDALLDWYSAGKQIRGTLEAFAQKLDRPRYACSLRLRFLLKDKAIFAQSQTGELVKCLRCLHKFRSSDRRTNRICIPCIAIISQLGSDWSDLDGLYSVQNIRN